MTYIPKIFAPLVRALFKRHRVVLPAALLAFLLLACFAIATRADNDDNDDDEPVNPQPAAQQAFVLGPETFDQWVFGGVVMRGPNNNAASQMDQRCQSLLNMRIDAIDRVCVLSEAQQKKLRLAASGDIKRFSD
ncbi:MAG TPA: hypothetical protein VGI75_00810, partial [Pirellulales bacterium]